MHFSSICAGRISSDNLPFALTKRLVDEKRISRGVRDDDCAVRAADRRPGDKRGALRFQAGGSRDSAHSFRVYVLRRCGDFEVDRMAGA
jgi:hypothetical protein